MMTIVSWFILPEGERGHSTTTYPNRGGHESQRAFKTAARANLKTRPDLYADELPDGFRTIKHIRGNGYFAQEVTVSA